MTDNNDQIAATKPLTGYKHPPTKNRFQKGRSGNPRGRPKESRNLVTVLSEESIGYSQAGRQVEAGHQRGRPHWSLAEYGEQRRTPSRRRRHKSSRQD